MTAEENLFVKRPLVFAVGMFFTFIAAALVSGGLMKILEWPGSSALVPGVLVVLIGSSIAHLREGIWSDLGMGLTVAPIIVFAIFGFVAAILLVPRRLDFAAVIGGIAGMVYWFVILRLEQKKAPYPGV